MRAWRTLVPVVACLVLGACATRGDYMTAQTRIRQQAGVIESQKGEVARLQGELARATAMIDGQKARLERLLAEKFGVQVTVNEEIKEELMGGLVFKLGSLEIDGSLLNRFHEAAAEVKKEARA